MNSINQYLTKRNFFFIVIFAIFGFVALQLPVAQVLGSKVKFTVFDAFAPITSAFIGSIPGVIAVFLMQLFNFLVHGARVEDAGTIIRFFPMLFATLYFAKKTKFNLIIPIIAIIGFIAHPIGRHVWYYSMFWTIPIFAYFFRDKFLLARALGATFTAHAVGGILWIWTFSLPAMVWNSLIPIVFVERLLLTLGMVGSFIVVNNLLGLLQTKFSWNIGFLVNQKYLLPFVRNHSTVNSINV